VAVAEASIQTIGERHAQAGARLYINIRTLLRTHPLATLRYISPMKRLTLAQDESAMEQMSSTNKATECKKRGKYEG
jgi:hypothetical protein